MDRCYIAMVNNLILKIPDIYPIITHIYAIIVSSDTLNMNDSMTIPNLIET